VRELGRILGGLLLVAIAGCASQDVSVGTAYDPLAVFPRQGTYVWDESSNFISEQIAHLDLADLLPPAIEGALANQGWRKVARAEADLLLSYQVSVATRIQVAVPGEEKERSRALGSLSIALRNPDDGRRLWVGFAEAEVTPSLSREERRTRLEEGLERLFQEFPP
jgi:hypothetical protein